MMSTVVVLLLLVVDTAITSKSKMASTEISCQAAIITWAEFTCDSTCNDCVHTSNEHEHSNNSCTSRQLTSQEVFLVYHHCPSPGCRLEAVPGLMGPVKADYMCLKGNGNEETGNRMQEIVDPCEEGNYTTTSVNFLYGYHRVVNTTSDVTCSCSLTKLNDSSPLNIKAVNAYSLQQVNNKLPEVTIEHDNKKERVNSSFPQDFIITTTTTNISLTLTVSSDDRIGRMWVSVSQQGQGSFSVQCAAVSGFIPVGTQETVQTSLVNVTEVPWILSAQVGVDTFVVICLIVFSIFFWRRKLRRKSSLDGAGRSKRQSEQLAACDMVDERGHMTLRHVDTSRDSQVRNATSLCLRPFTHIVHLAQRYRASRVLAINECAPIV
ncbi:uncharacterized protein LOC112567341 isoform X2 [Pomacea canaliculata]|uniref:uncharacterized protein LOC112567341 isoform X2 n=1 Tax=Pomacea canaliculata TaxID=400727 RepID=UPI000D72DC37|nr:uncharacterized protein LOC112567341 isoform X2 [Pomacea canaliculata]